MTRVLLAVSLFVFCLVAFEWRASLFDYLTVLDARTWYSPADIAALFRELGDRREFYFVSELSLDLIFPVVYAFLLFRLARWISGSDYAWVAWLAIVPAALDFLENVLIAFMLRAYDPVGGAAPIGAGIAPYLTLSKLIGLVAFALILAFLAATRLFRAERVYVPEGIDYTTQA